MGQPSGPRQGAEARPIVAFDFDGTLTFRDSFMGFLAWRAGPIRYASGLMALLPDALAYLDHRSRGRLKAAAVGVFLKGLHRSELERSCQAFAESRLGRRLIRPDAEQCWRDWRGKGARLVIVTASPYEVVEPFARRLGADDLIATRLMFDHEDRVMGALMGENCRGVEKVARLRNDFGPDVRLAAAYGDSAGDAEMLAIAGIKGYRVFNARPG